MSDWPQDILGNVANFRGGGTPSKKESSYWHGNIPWVSPKDMKSAIVSSSQDKITSIALENSSASLISADSILVVVRSGILARTIPVAKTGRELSVNQDIKAICPKPRLYVDFLYYLFRAKEPELLRLVTRGATVHRLSTDSLKQLPVPLPPLPEQKRIVAILDETFAGIATAIVNAEKNLQNARELYDSYLESVFLRKGKDWEKIELAALLKRGWITSHLDGNHGSNYPRKSEFVLHGIFYLSANCLKNEKVDFSLAKYLSPERAELLKKGRAQNNDVLFAHNATVGPVAILKTSEIWVLLSTSLTYYRCDPDHIIPEYLAHYMRSHTFKSQYKSVMRQSTRNQVPITKQREFIHVIPPLEAQKRLAGQLDSLSYEAECLQHIYDEKLILLRELKQAVLQKAFAGELH